MGNNAEQPKGLCYDCCHCTMCGVKAKLDEFITLSQGYIFKHHSYIDFKAIVTDCYAYKEAPNEPT